MTRQELFEQIQAKKSFLCIGLDSDLAKLPQHLLEEQDPVFEFNKAIIDATHSYCIAYKPNTAFYEANGVAGWVSFDKTVNYIKTNYPEVFIIADAKRGDIGNTSAMYARAFFESMPCDSVTVAPYMGSDSVQPFLSYPNKWVILLALTSNAGAKDFQFIPRCNNVRLFETVLTTSQEWGTPDNMMYVVGATKSHLIADVRRLAPEHFLLVPGVGAQGGSLSEVAEKGMNKQCGLIVNSSRGIIFADASPRFADMAAEKAQELQLEMAALLEKYL